MNPWEKVKFAHECEPCDCCDEPFCEEHGLHYADCDCVGPTQDDYEYEDRAEGLYARQIQEKL